MLPCVWATRPLDATPLSVSTSARECHKCNQIVILSEVEGSHYYLQRSSRDQNQLFANKSHSRPTTCLRSVFFAGQMSNI